MRISERCAACLYDKQKNKTDDEEYLSEIRRLLDDRKETDTSPYMVYQFNKVHVRRFGAGADYKDIKKKYNDLVLGMEGSLREDIEKSEDSLAKALIMARVGNYIDLGAMNHVNQDEFLSLFCDTEMREDDRQTYDSFLEACERGKTFLLVCDNCGEIVLDKRFRDARKKDKVRSGGEVPGCRTLS